MSDYGFCRVYTTLEGDALNSVLPAYEEPVLAEVRPNANKPHRTDDFIFWPSCVEIEQVGEESVDLGIVSAVRATLRAIAAAGGTAVASCGFEDEVNAT